MSVFMLIIKEALLTLLFTKLGKADVTPFYRFSVCFIRASIALFNEVSIHEPN